MATEDAIVRWSGENIIEYIEEYRDELIFKFISDPNKLKSYLRDRHQVSELSATKQEFIIRALKELSESSIDLAFYSPLILKLRKNDSIMLSGENENLFYQDMDKVLKNYIL